MTLTIELRPETEANLSMLAAKHGLALPQYVQQVLEDQILSDHSADARTPQERAIAWRASVKGLPIRPPLSDEAISRSSIYDVRG